VDTGNFSQEFHPDGSGGGFADDSGGCNEDDVEVRSPLEIAHVDPDTPAKSTCNDAYGSPEMEYLRRFAMLSILEIGLKPAVKVPRRHY